jgi:hypothetical protein
MLCWHAIRFADRIKQISNRLSHSAAPNKAFDLTGKDALSGQ